MSRDRIFIISDAHLGAQSEQQEQVKADLLSSFLKHVREQGNRLIICGDLFDFWFEYRYVVPKRHFRILAELSVLSHAGITIHYVAGNHDFWMDSFMVEEVGMSIHPDDLQLDQNGKKIYFRHGDGILKKDYLYRFLKKVLRNPLNYFLYRLIHPDWGVPLALFFSNWSRNAAQKEENHYSDEEYRQFAFDRIHEGYDIVVLGHSHVPALLPHGEGWYVNAGNWMETFTFAVIEEAIPTLRQWQGNGFVPFPSKN